jgi:DNA replication factor GINS
MNLDELQSVQARERQSSDLQHLRSSFYQEVGEFINELNEERARVVEAAGDPFSEPEVRRLSDDIETAEGTVEAIYERRVGKVVKKASIAAAGMPVEEDGLTNEERALFDDLVDRIEQNRGTVLSVLDGNAPSVSCSLDDEADPSPVETPDDTANAGAPQHSEPDPSSTSADGGVSAADLMGGASNASADTGDQTAADAASNLSTAESSSVEQETPEPPSSAETPTDPSELDLDSTPIAESALETVEPDETRAPSQSTDTSSESDAGADPRDVPGLPRTTVRITDDVGEIVGADDRDYDLGSEDVVTLPEPNADVLVQKDAAERL